VCYFGYYRYSQFKQDSTKLETHDITYKSLLTFLEFLHGLLPFLLGFYLSIAVARWWAIRNDCIGALWGAVDDLCLLLGAYLPGDPQSANAKSRVCTH
jgi:hypothetical protein